MATGAAAGASGEVQRAAGDGRCRDGAAALPRAATAAVPRHERQPIHQEPLLRGEEPHHRQLPLQVRRA